METGWKTDFLLGCLSLWRAGGVTGRPRRVRVPFGMRARPSTERRKGSGSAALLAALRLSYNLPRRLGKTLRAWRGCDATRPGGQGRSSHFCSALLRGFGIFSWPPGTTPRQRVFLWPGAAILLGLSRAKNLSRSSAYAAEQRL